MKEHLIFNIKFNEISFSQIISIVENSINLKNKIKIGYTNPHLARLSLKEKDLEKVLNDFDINHIDGTGLTIALRLLGNKKVSRFNWTDHAFTFLSECEKKGWSIFFLGGEQASILKAVQKVKQFFPHLKVAGFLNGYNDLNDDSLSVINKSTPDILWVGLGSPKQELWIDRNFENLQCSVIQCVGDIFSYIAGNRLRGPQFLRRFGFEWLFRLIQHPVRYFNRYVIGIPYFLFLVLRYKLHKH